jgi:sugar lactone lactonase YvrE
MLKNAVVGFISIWALCAGMSATNAELIGSTDCVESVQLTLTCMGELSESGWIDFRFFQRDPESPGCPPPLDNLLADCLVNSSDLKNITSCDQVSDFISQAIGTGLTASVAQTLGWEIESNGVIRIEGAVRFLVGICSNELITSCSETGCSPLECTPIGNLCNGVSGDEGEPFFSGVRAAAEYIPCIHPRLAGEGILGAIQTGQTTIYDSHDDASYKRGLDRSFRDNNDGTITDLTSGLIWVKDPGAAGLGHKFSFADAVQVSDNLVFAGNADWRLPTVEELSTLINVGPPIYQGAITDPIFIGEQYRYWTSTSYVDVSSKAWSVDEAGGVNFFDKTDIFFVRPVRQDSSPSNAGRFSLSTDGKIVHDSMTELQWVRDPGDAGVGGAYYWEDAILACENLDYAGFSDWRLPNRNELQSTIDYERGIHPAWYQEFGGRSDVYWTSTKSLHPLRPFPWVVEAGLGSVNGRDYWVGGPAVRPVRSGLKTPCSGEGGEPAPTSTATATPIPSKTPTATHTKTYTPIPTSIFTAPPTPSPTETQILSASGGHILVRTGNNSHIVELDMDGHQVREIGNGGLLDPSAFMIGHTGNLLVSNSQGLLEFSLITGSFLRVFSHYDDVPGYAKDTVMGPDGNIYLADSSGGVIRKYDGWTGENQGIFIQDSHLAFPDGMTFGGNGNLLVTSGGYSGQTVLEFNGSSGAFVKVFADDPRLAGPFDITCGPDETDFYLSSRNNSQIVEIDATSGQVTRVLGKGVGLVEPTGLLITPDRKLFVSDFQTGQIHKFDVDSGDHLGVLATVSAGGPVFLGYLPPPGSGNRPPTEPVVSISPQDPGTLDDLHCKAEGSFDPEGATVSYRYRWRIDGVTVASVEGPVLGNELTHRGQVVECVVTPSDGQLDGPSRSASVVILNTLPRAPQIRLLPEHPSPHEGMAVWFDGLSSDADGDSVVYLFEWYESQDGVNWRRRPEVSGNLIPFFPGEPEISGIYTTFTQGGEHWRVVVTPIESWILNGLNKGLTDGSEIPVGDSAVREVIVLYDLDGNHNVNDFDLFMMSRLWHQEKRNVPQSLRTLLFDDTEPDDTTVTIRQFLTLTIQGWHAAQ